MAALTARDLAALVRLVQRLRSILEAVIEQDPSLVFGNQAAFEAVRDGWSDIQPRFNSVLRQLRNQRYGASLRAHGLTGRQLQMKVRLYELLADDVERELERSRSRVNLRSPLLGRLRLRPGRHSSEIGRRLRRALKPFLDYANAIFDSLAAAIPAFGAIKEFKEGVEAAIEIRRGLETTGPSPRETHRAR